MERVASPYRVPIHLKKPSPGVRIEHQTGIQCVRHEKILYNLNFQQY